MSPENTGGTGGAGSAESVDAESTHTGGAAPGKKGMSTGAKLFFGCLGLIFVGVIGLGVAVTVGGVALKRGFDSAMGSVEDHREATETLQRLEREHPFQPPEDGVVREAQVQEYLAVARDAWQEMEPWAEDLRDLKNDARANRGAMDRLKEVATGAKAVGGFARSRLALASALEDHDLSLGEFAWTGLTLSKASEALERGNAEASGIPAENLQLARAHASELPRLDDEEGSGTVLVVATLWGMNELPTWRGLGLDTLGMR